MTEYHKVQCRAKTKTGEQCKKTTTQSPYCWIHLKSKDHLQIIKSSIPNAGKGLKTTVPIDKGKRIDGYYEGKHRFVDEGDNTFFPYGFEIKKGEVVDPYRSTDTALRYANCKPTKADNNAQFGVDRVRHKVIVKSTKRIPAGAEIFVDYGKDYRKYLRNLH